MGYGAGHAALPPVFVVTHEPPSTEWRLGDRFRFVTDGVAAAVDQPRAPRRATGTSWSWGAATSIRQAVAGRARRRAAHPPRPELLGDGTPLFGADAPRQLTQVDVVVSPTATHLRYQVGDLADAG